MTVEGDTPSAPTAVGLPGGELLLRQILDTSSVGIFLVDLQGCIIQANRRMGEMFGWPMGAMWRP